MAKQKKIQDNDGLYNFLRYYVDSVLKLSYRKIQFIGTEKIPQDGAVIYAPNHTNALMDALVILAIDKKPKVFVARADIFKNPKLAKILAFLKILPIMRIRDGFNEVKKNQETIEKAADVLKDRIPFCIFPEGTHQAMYSSLPLSKGIFRIAIQAQSLIEDQPLYIVPVGIKYGHFFRYRSTAKAVVGEPINIREFLEKNNSYTPQEQLNILKEILDERMKETHLYIPNDEDYNATYEICNTLAPYMEKMEAGKIVAEIKKNKPELAAELMKLGNEAFKLRTATVISQESAAVKYPIFSRFLSLLTVILLLPFTLPAAILTLPINAICAFLFTKLKDYAFRNSIRFLMNLVLWPILMIIYSSIAYCMMPWQIALPLTLLLLPAPIFAHDSWRHIRLAGSDILLLFHKDLKKKYKQIRNLVLNR